MEGAEGGCVHKTHAAALVRGTNMTEVSLVTRRSTNIPALTVEK